MKYRELNIFEKNLLTEIADANFSKHPMIKDHINKLLVKNIDITGVGLFISFKYKCCSMINKETFMDVLYLSSENLLYIDGLNFPVNYELNITDGKIDFLEIVTNGEQWNGKIIDFKISRVNEEE